MIEPPYSRDKGAKAGIDPPSDISVEDEGRFAREKSAEERQDGNWH